MDLDLLDILTDPDLGGTDFTYDRVAATVNDKGRTVQTMTTLQASGNIQPAPGKERELLPEGDRTKEALLIFTVAELSAGSETTAPDLVTYRGRKYRVAMVEPWREHGGFTKAVAVLESL